jgi:hypothetical protein
MQYVDFHTYFKCSVIKEKTAVDRFIIKFKDVPHESIVHAVSYKLLTYASLKMG